jgi:hypothetical protein
MDDTNDSVRTPKIFAPLAIITGVGNDLVRRVGAHRKKPPGVTSVAAFWNL